MKYVLFPIKVRQLQKLISSGKEIDNWSKIEKVCGFAGDRQQMLAFLARLNPEMELKEKGEKKDSSFNPALDWELQETDIDGESQGFVNIELTNPAASVEPPENAPAKRNKRYGGKTASLVKSTPNPDLIRQCYKVFTFWGGSLSDNSPRWDYDKLCVRLKSFRELNPARKEEEGRPAILVMADVSTSCKDFSERSIAVAKAASKIGVPGADIIVLSHSNGLPLEMEANGHPKECVVDAHNFYSFYEYLFSRYAIRIVVALGDDDAMDYYSLIVSKSQVLKFIWLNDHGNDYSLKDLRRYGLKLDQKDEGKFFYRRNCKYARDFLYWIGRLAQI